MRRRALETATARYEQTAPAAHAYLAARGIDAGVAAMYRLGCVVDPEVGHEDLRGRLSIPYLTPAGVVDLRFRALGDQQPKYLSVAGSAPHLYNVGALWRDSDYIAICEGELDALVLDGIVGIPALGVPGANNWKGHWARLLEDYRTVFVMCDGDDAGRDFGKALGRSVPAARVIHLPTGQDVNSLYLAQGVAGVRQLMGV